MSLKHNKTLDTAKNTVHVSNNITQILFQTCARKRQIKYNITKQDT